MTTYKSQYINCPQIEKLIQANKGKGTLTVTTIETKPIKIEVKDDVRGMVLSFAFPYCQKRKQD